ncbi:hypothetical protein [Spirosoma sp. KNUC1025]|uniref:hypothetical protein n=1 Tax=Spirosoma sp. KNUC1025 TaxID=2894082 RepID=UPI003863F953|nr:hypothetical protein LN737_05190 [Spirosoma sp. KNUC1025]
MQNYNNFIDELFRLKIESVEYFVSNGQVLYPWDNHYLPEHFLPGTPENRLPGHKSDFFSLERYAYAENRNRYTNELGELRRRAVNDIILLEPQQAKRILLNAQQKLEQLKSLRKNAAEYQKAWYKGTLDQLPDCFLELKILYAFVTPDRPKANPHKYFAIHLCKTIAWKCKELSTLIEECSLDVDSQHPSIGDKNAETSFKSFDDLFKSKEDMIYCLQALKDYVPAVINERLQWTGKKGSKAVLTGWIDKIDAEGYIPTMDRIYLVPLLTQKFPGLSISRRTLYDSPKANVAEEIKNYFSAHILH